MKNRVIKIGLSLLFGLSLASAASAQATEAGRGFWQGRLNASFVGGWDAGLAVEDALYRQAYLVDANISPLLLGQRVLVEAVWSGFTCAYARTAFGACVPELRVLSIKALP